MAAVKVKLLSNPDASTEQVVKTSELKSSLSLAQMAVPERYLYKYLGTAKEVMECQGASCRLSWGTGYSVHCGRLIGAIHVTLFGALNGKLLLFGALLIQILLFCAS